MSPTDPQPDPTPAAADHAAPDLPSGTAPAPSRRLWWIVGIVVVLAAGGGVAAYLLSDRPDSPKPAAKAFARAMADGDEAGIRDHSTGDDASLKAMLAEAKKNAAYERLAAAARKKFGDENTVLPGRRAKDAWANRVALIDETPAEVKGNDARIGDMPMSRVGGQWKVDRVRLLPPGDPLALAPLAEALGRVYEDVGAGIDGGRFPAAAAAKEALGEGTRAAVNSQIGKPPQQAATRPATMPATRPTSVPSL